MRVEGWESLLNDYITRAYRATFAWGKADCALWCADWVKAATGKDFGDGWRGRYSTETGAARLMRKRGYADVAAIADAHLNPIPLPLARRGDIVLNADGCLGICTGVYSFFLAADSVTRSHTADCRKAWAV